MDVVSEPTHLPALADTLPGMELTTVGLRIVDDDAILRVVVAEEAVAQ